MKRTNLLITALSAIAVVIVVERVSSTTVTLLPPYGFLHLHEVVQMLVITTASVVVSFLILRAVSDDFRDLVESPGVWLAGLFLVGTYFYATGNGAHEIGSFIYGYYCNAHVAGGAECGSAYINDYFFGNIVYFVGLGLSSLAIVLLERRRPDTGASTKDGAITLANGLVLALTFTAYDGFDRVWVGLIATMVFAVVFGGLLLTGRRPFRSLPFTMYSVVGFSLAAIASLPIRILHG